LDGSDDKSSKSNKKSQKSQKSIRPSKLFDQSLIASGGRPAPPAMVPQNDAINMSIQSQSALLNQSNIALQMEINK